MSEFEETSGPAKNKSLWIAVIAVVVVGGCLLVCAGIAAVGLVVPAVVRERQQAMQAEQAARNAEQMAKAQAAAQDRAVQGPAAATEDHPATKETAEPTAGDAPAKEGGQVDKEGSRANEP